MKATHDKNLLLASVAISLLIIIIMSVASFQYKQLQKQKALLIQEEKEHFATINVLQKKALNLYPKFVEICSVVLQKHFKMELQEDMNKAIDYLKSMLIGELSSMFPVKNEKTDYEHLSNKEQLIYLLSEYGFSNEEIANILLITEANVRSTKSKIKKNSETF
jgi:DNA-binding NarL/FixJ family response regulator